MENPFGYHMQKPHLEELQDQYEQWMTCDYITEKLNQQIYIEPKMLPKAEK